MIGDAVRPAEDPLEGVWAVVVNWNGGEQNLACLTSLAEAGVPAERTVFVDNGSVDGSLVEVCGRFPGLVHVDNPSNLGFGEGANQGARLALERGATAVFWVNNDVTLPESTPRRLAEELAARPRLGLVGPRVLLADRPDRLWAAGGRLDHRQNLSTLLGHGRPDELRWRRTTDVDYVPGCALLARRECLEAIGLFEASYFAYMEDVELGLRARRAGWGVSVLGEVACLHDASASTGGGYTPRRKYMQALNSVRFLRTYGRPVHWLRFVLFDVLPLPLLGLVGLATGRARGVAAKALGLTHGLLGRTVRAEVLEPGGTFLW